MMETRRSGFTLIEIMVVIAVIGMLATLVAPNVLGQLGRAKEEAAGRKPSLPLRRSRRSVRLYADRHFGAMPFQQPPRRTRCDASMPQSRRSNADPSVSAGTWFADPVVGAES